MQLYFPHRGRTHIPHRGIDYMYTQRLRVRRHTFSSIHKMAEGPSSCDIINVRMRNNKQLQNFCLNEVALQLFLTRVVARYTVISQSTVVVL